MLHPAQVIRGVAYFWGGSLAFSPCRLQLLKGVQRPKQGTLDRGFVTREFAESVDSYRIPPKGGPRALSFSPQKLLGFAGTFHRFVMFFLVYHTICNGVAGPAGTDSSFISPRFFYGVVTFNG